MPVSFRVDPETDWFEGRYSGVVLSSDVEAALAAFFASHDYQPGHDSLLLFDENCEVADLVTCLARVRETLATYIAAAGRKSKWTRNALVVPPVQTDGVGRLWDLLTRDDPILMVRNRIFESEAEARAWLLEA